MEIMRMERRLRISNCRVTLLLCCILLMLTDCDTAPPKQDTTESPFPVATVIPWVKKSPTRYADSYDDYEESPPYGSSSTDVKSPLFTPPQLILTVLRTVVDVLRGINAKKLKSDTTKRKDVVEKPTTSDQISNKTVVNKMLSINHTENSTEIHKSRGMDHMDHGVSYEDIIHDDHHEYHHEPEPMVVVTTEAPKEMMKQSRYSDPWSGYYDFIITEASFKFWSFFQLFTAGVLLYSALAAVYYAKFNPIQPDYDTTYDEYFFGRSLEDNAPQADTTSATPAPGWLSGLTGMGFQRIMDAVSSLDGKHTSKD